MIRGNHVNRDNSCFDMHLNKKDSIVSLKNLDSKELYPFFLDKIVTTPTSQIYFGRLFGPILNWDKIYLDPCIVTKDSYIHIFQYKLLNNILFLNSRLFHLNFSDSPLCSLCNNFVETPNHFFSECLITQLME